MDPIDARNESRSRRVAESEADIRFRQTGIEKSVMDSVRNKGELLLLVVEPIRRS
jgi:hypothetical protein